MQGSDFSFSNSLTVAEFCRQERISKNLAYRLIKEGRIPVYRLSPRKTRIDLAAVRAKLTEGVSLPSSKELEK